MQFASQVNNAVKLRSLSLFVRWRRWRLLLIICLQFVQLLNANKEFCTLRSTRPFYVIGHMANSIELVKEFLYDGANAIEIDVQFYSNGIPKLIYHGLPCDCLRYKQKNLSI